MDQLLNEACVKLGFCLKGAVAERLYENPPATVDSFTDALIVAEGLDPKTYNPDVRGQLRECVAKYHVAP